MAAARLRVAAGLAAVLVAGAALAALAAGTALVARARVAVVLGSVVEAAVVARVRVVAGLAAAVPAAARVRVVVVPVDVVALAAAAAARAVVALPVALGSFTVPAMTSLKYLPGRNAGTVVFLTLTASPVRGLRAVRAARARFSKTPNPEIDTLLALLHLALDEVDESLDRRLRRLFVSLQPFGELVDEVGLVHGLLQERFPGPRDDFWAVWGKR